MRGHAFAPRPPDTSGPVPGQLARLVREPDNPADRLAVGVWVADARGRWRIGYLDRGVAARLAPRIDHGFDVQAEIDGWTPEPDGRWRRPVVVLLPTRDQPAQDRPEHTSGDTRGDTPGDTRDDTGGLARTAGAPGTSDRSSPTGDPSPPSVREPRGPGLWGRPPGVVRRRVRTR